MTTPTLPTTLTDTERATFNRLAHRAAWRPQRTAPGSVNGATTGKVAWYHGGPDGRLHAITHWAPGKESGRIEALCAATSWGWSESARGDARFRCSECATKAHGLPLLNGRPN